ncbi:DegT/DnrJ/EryC1/StrS family aminotransferase [Paenibacillus koleovorans]|uniref:DegT/DnrJ/EryC1/StrS family aminotransferase n=1 Tax=Paenibacillus koleovorans TaxID=121608 RepID=UPI000FDB9ACF|nr:DegT/DnrJ/EryC1/StrS family aminotransferase [Paenibacillus koleovorans]
MNMQKKDQPMNVNDPTPVRTKPWAPVFLSSEEFGEEERESLMNVLEKKRVFRFYKPDVANSEARKLERLYRERLDVEHCLVMNSGTSALVSALIAAGVGPGDEVIIPAYTYIATASAVLIARAVPVIVEVDESLTMDPKAISAAITPYTKAVIPVHMKGVPCRMDEIMEIAEEHGLVVIEDVAQANGGSYNGKPLGTFGLAGCFSFQQFKLITSGEGGMMVTNDRKLYKRASIYHDSALAFWGTEEENIDVPSFPGENYRMSEINAALGLAQSRRIDQLVTKLRQVKKTIVDGIRDLPELQLQTIPDPEGDVSYVLIFYLKDQETARSFSDQLRLEGIPNGTIFNNGIADRHLYVNWEYVLEKRGISDKDNPWQSPLYKGNVQYDKEMCPRTLDLFKRAILINLHQQLTLEDCDDAIRAIRKVARAHRDDT